VGRQRWHPLGGMSMDAAAKSKSEILADELRDELPQVSFSRCGSARKFAESDALPRSDP